MEKNRPLSTLVKTSIICMLLSGFSITAMAIDPPFTVKTDLFDQTNTVDLGLSEALGTETFTVFEPTSTTDKFSNGVVMTAFKGKLYCQWQSSVKDEDASDTWVAYSYSVDGKTWVTPQELAPTIDNGYCSSGGWWVNGDTLVAYINTWPETVKPRGGFTQYRTSIDGISWTPIKPLLMENGDTLQGIFEQDPHALPDGRIIGAAHFQPGLMISPIYTDDSSGTRGWVRADFTSSTPNSSISNEIEPSWFLRSDDTLVMVFRDQSGSKLRLASTSGDRGETWSKAVKTNMPDSRSKQSAGNIADSATFLVGNPVTNTTRIPLAITLSREGTYYNTAYVLRKGGSNIQALRYSGKAKRSGYHYPKSMVFNDTLYVSYATNKEDVEYTRVPLASLTVDTSKAPIPVIPPVSSTSFAELNYIKISLSANGILNITNQDYSSNAMVRIFNLNGQILYSNRLINGEGSYNMNPQPAGIYIVEIRTDLERKTQLFHMR